MSGRSLETNPHFHPHDQLELAHEVPHHQLQPDPNRRGRRLSRQQQRRHDHPQPIPTPTPHSPPPSPPHQIPYVPPMQHHTQTPYGHKDHFPLHQIPPHTTQPPPHTTQPPPHTTRPPGYSTQLSPVQPTHPSSSNVRMPHGRKTRPHTWLIGVLCGLFWVAIILGGLVVLIVYLLFRPRGPKFDIAAASLNAAYLDMGYLLNADMTILANFTNPSKKATVDFHRMNVNLYFGNTLISTTYVEPFKEMKAESAFRNVHLVSSQVVLPLRERDRMAQQIEGNRIRFEVEGFLRTRSNLGSLFRYSYWLYGHCIIEVTGPPSGILVGKKCTTKR